MRFMQRVERPPLLAIVHKTQPPTYYFMGENGADLAFDPSKLPQGWMEQVKWAHFGCISLVRQPLGETLAALAAQLRAHGVKISFDPNYRNLMEHGYEPTLRKMAALADLIKVSDEDLRMLFTTASPKPTRSRRLRAMNPQATRARHARLERGDALCRRCDVSREAAAASRSRIRSARAMRRLPGCCTA